jgi:glucose-1-phosphate adenylyltransferase
VLLDQGTVIEESLLLPYARVGRDVTVRRSVVDKYCHLPHGFSVGIDHDADRARGFHVTERGITLITPEMLGQDFRTRGGTS